MNHVKSAVATLLFVLGAGTAPALAEAPVPLEKEPHINQSLMAGVAGDEIRKNCPGISPRYLVVWDKLYKLKKYAISKGYDRDRVKAFLKDPAQKARVRAMAQAYLKAHGVKPSDRESYCALGRQEIANKSLIGVMLRMK